MPTFGSPSPSPAHPCRRPGCDVAYAHDAQAHELDGNVIALDRDGTNPTRLGPRGGTLVYATVMGTRGTRQYVDQGKVNRRLSPTKNPTEVQGVLEARRKSRPRSPAEVKATLLAALQTSEPLLIGTAKVNFATPEIRAGLCGLSMGSKASTERVGQISGVHLSPIQLTAAIELATSFVHRVLDDTFDYPSTRWQPSWLGGLFTA
jgi:hypothetical protein